MCRSQLKRERKDPFNVKSVTDVRIMFNVLMLRSLPVTLTSIFSLLSLGEVTCLLTPDTCVQFSNTSG